MTLVVTRVRLAVSVVRVAIGCVRCLLELLRLATRCLWWTLWTLWALFLTRFPEVRLRCPLGLRSLLERRGKRPSLPARIMNPRLVLLNRGDVGLQLLPILPGFDAAGACVLIRVGDVAHFQSRVSGQCTIRAPREWRHAVVRGRPLTRSPYAARCITRFDSIKTSGSRPDALSGLHMVGAPLGVTLVWSRQTRDCRCVAYETPRSRCSLVPDFDSLILSWNLHRLQSPASTRPYSGMELRATLHGGVYKEDSRIAPGPFRHAHP